MFQIKRIIIRESDKALESKESLEKFRRALAVLTGSNIQDITFVFEEISTEVKIN